MGWPPPPPPLLVLLLSLVGLVLAGAVHHPPLFNRIISSSTTPQTPQQKALNLTTDDDGEADKTIPIKMPPSATVADSMETKIRRLKALRSEMRALTSLIREEKRRQRRKENSSSASRAHSASPSPSSAVVADAMRSEISHHFRKWRKRLQSKMRSLQHRMDEVEAELGRTRENLQKVLRERHKGAKWSKQPAPLSADTIRRVQLRRRGERGSRCHEHGDCKPGHCCQRAAPFSALPLAVAAEGAGHCVRFARAEGAPCEHSCACETQLLCFREHAKAKNSSIAICKRASSTDLLNGMYENTLQTMFDHPKT